ncbi:hypothetical protein B0H17DRAFT_1132797 [Mycena rosella]|uniref:Uncharacterized protein n=1 Tax=Mycena rosella TaxID=1033263 RepID=A0AAD7DJC0_MYCRO|nr:hypothetical protein B0H17DRAFT_1132797 [Mycena rosella]
MHFPHVWVLALWLSFSSLGVTAQSSSSTSGPLDVASSSTAVAPSVSSTAPFTFQSSFPTTAGTPFTRGATSAVTATDWYPAPSSGVYAASGISKGPVVAAAVGGSIASCLVVLAGTLFCFHHRSRPGRPPNSSADAAPAEAENKRRCDELESQVRALRDQLARLEARVDGGPAILYTNEKDPEAFDKPADGARRKESPPTYAD